MPTRATRTASRLGVITRRSSWPFDPLAATVSTTSAALMNRCCRRPDPHWRTHVTALARRHVRLRGEQPWHVQQLQRYLLLVRHITVPPPGISELEREPPVLPFSRSLIRSLVRWLCHSAAEKSVYKVLFVQDLGTNQSLIQYFDTTKDST